jgi:DNA-binding transcriptional LysR family regulator
MRYVIAVAEEGSFQRAAARLHIAQPALSRQIRQLERELGVDLFERRPTRVAPPGAVFVERARKILADVEATAQRTRLAAQGEVGTVRVGYGLAVTDNEVRRLIGRVGTDHPAIEVHGVELSDAELHDALDRGDVDLALGRGVAPRPGFVTEVLRRESLHAVLPSDHPLAAGESVALADLRGATFRFFPRRFAPVYFDLVVELLGSTGETFEVWQNPDPGLRNAADRHLDGFTVVPASVGEQLLDGVRCVPISDNLPLVDLVIMWPARATSQPAQHVVRAAYRLAADDHWLAPA